MRTQRSVAGLGVALLFVATLVAGGVLTPSSGILPVWFVPVGAVIIALGLVFPVARPASRRLAILAALMAVIVSWAADVLLVKAAALVAAGLVMVAIAWHGTAQPGGTS